MINVFKNIVTLLAFVASSKAQNVPGICFCVTSGSCNNFTGGVPGGDGTGQIDIRIQTNGVPSTGNTGTSIQLTTAASSGINTIVNSPQFCQNGLERCCPTSGFTCGNRYPAVPGSRAPLAGSGQAAFGAYPWQAVILAPGDIYQGSGALIDQLHVITAAHRVNQFLTNGQQLKVRLGEWDAASSTEPIPAQEFNVARIFIHPQFTATNLRNDIAILRLITPVQLGQVPTITTACLPSTVVTNIRCWVAGWGRNDFSNNGAYQAIQKEVDVPLIDQNTCQNQLRATRLGFNFQLDFASFVCAGGEPGKDACTGDGGSPLMCQIGSNWYVAGLVAWGIGCGQANVPGVYVNVANYISWIQQTTRSLPKNSKIVNKEVCICVTTGSCNITGSKISERAVNVRILNNVSQSSTTQESVFSVSSGSKLNIASQIICQTKLEKCCFPLGYECGLRYPAVSGAIAPLSGQAAFGSYSWQAVLLTTNNEYQGSGALIDHINILTSAHKVADFLNKGKQLKVRLGEWDASTSEEPIQSQEFLVSQIFVHPQYEAGNLRNSVAILRLVATVPLGATPTIGTVCLPSNPISNQRCWISGWGKNDFSSNGTYESILREVEVPLVDAKTCQNRLRASRLGLNFQLDTESFMCAGGEDGKDACTGDGGAPLVCDNGGRWFVAGLVAWGIGCGSNIPGIYINVSNYISWIQSVTQYN